MVLCDIVITLIIITILFLFSLENVMLKDGNINLTKRDGKWSLKLYNRYVEMFPTQQARRMRDSLVNSSNKIQQFSWTPVSSFLNGSSNYHLINYFNPTYINNIIPFLLHCNLPFSYVFNRSSNVSFFLTKQLQ